MSVFPENRPVNKKILIDLIGVLLIAIVVVVGYKLSPMLLPKADVTVDSDPACDLQQGACAVALPGGGRLTLEMGTRPIPLVRPFDVQVRLNGVDARQVEVDFAGLDMSMGYNRLRLAERTPGVFVAEASLPVCVTGQMTWQATVLLETAAARLAIPFRFVTR